MRSDTSLRGTVLREVPVQLLDLSLSGCLLTSNSQIPDGAFGRLQVMMGGARYHETLRIVRSTEQLGVDRPHLFGGAFSAPERPSDDPVPGGVRKIVPGY